MRSRSFNPEPPRDYTVVDPRTGKVTAAGRLGAGEAIAEDSSRAPRG